jgi:hypothetical protein
MWRNENTLKDHATVIIHFLETVFFKIDFYLEEHHRLKRLSEGRLR